MRKLKIGNCLLVLLLFGLMIAAQGQPNQFDSSLERARKLWELAVAAKGGRERLNQINNFVKIFAGERTHYIQFVALPDRYLSWYDHSGPNTLVYNFASGFGYYEYFAGRKYHETYKDMRREMKSYDSAKMEFLYRPQIEYFLETRWLRPKLLSASKATIGRKNVDRVDVLVEVENLRIRFAVFLDEKTHLPVRVGSCRDEKTCEQITRGMDFRAYREIAGIKIPTESCGIIGGDKWNRIHFEINAEYNPEVFDRPPDPNAGPYQWRKVGSKASGPLLTETSQPEPLAPAQIAQLV
ncbi:MAG: hypothetical protein MN733_37715, partial [Nitrososphaera sp.]|nr:hypothetical protein [Nitrososphaera sp.]